MRNHESVKTRFLEELEKHRFIKKTCEKLGLPRATFYRWKSDDPKFKLDIEKIQRRNDEEACEVAESVVFGHMSDGSLSASKFVLTHLSPKYKSVKEQRAILETIIEKFSRFRTPRLEENDIEF